jgi:hypothetical protein
MESSIEPNDAEFALLVIDSDKLNVLVGISNGNEHRAKFELDEKDTDDVYYNIQLSDAIAGVTSSYVSGLFKKSVHNIPTYADFMSKYNIIASDQRLIDIICDEVMYLYEEKCIDEMAEMRDKNLKKEKEYIKARWSYNKFTVTLVLAAVTFMTGISVPISILQKDYIGTLELLIFLGISGSMMFYNVYNKACK